MASIITAITPFTLQSLPDFPYDQWRAQQELYDSLEYIYSGEALDVKLTDPSSGKSTDKYPIKLNPLKGTAKKHASTVFGQNVDSIRHGGLPFQIIPDLDKEQKDIAQKFQDVIMKVLASNNFGTGMYGSTITSQYLGGAVIAAKFLPEENRIEVHFPNPKEFLGIPKGANYWNLMEGWIVKEITEKEARYYGYIPKMGETKFYYIEKWTETEYKIMVNGEVIAFKSNGIKQEGEHGYGRVPIIYVPHIREDGFIGQPIITDAVEGIIKELNLRWADIGDAVSEDSHSFVAVRNIRGSVKVLTIDGRPVVDLGSNTGISSNELQPDMFAVRTQSASSPMIAFGEELMDAYRREVNHPAVADGEDEGSQRSSLTLTTRMWPLVAEAEAERLFWTSGLIEFTRILTSIMVSKNMEGATKEMLDYPLIVQWQPMLPRDREALVQEAGVRASNDLGSKRHLMGLFGDVQDTETMLEEVIDEKEQLTKFEQQPQFGNNTSNNTGANTPGNSAD